MRLHDQGASTSIQNGFPEKKIVMTWAFYTTKTTEHDRAARQASTQQVPKM